ncbi:LPXTG-motif cell wall anchor domain-containing protein [Corynebacterium mycetoides]|uniref:LPXTG-motif cell wall anchor domain-containing protein n=1 Tax=Corynebacterium mycetoides TaxID=38302 RepID=A0A1G9Q0B3_9CORY|nr:SpaA isopeptide-forming pilin-related protein [Corynebacterium mycetoides]SDM04508.1 LPXTG-motif cell wall anchor domain-containing protein [Corynebacterium mycetoides]
MKRLIAAISAATLLGALPLTAESAQAQTRVITGNDRAVPAGGVDTSRGIDLVVRELPVNPYDEVPEGALPYGGIEGLRFTLFRANGVDVTTPTGRADAARSRTEEEFNALEVTEVASRLTDGTGEATFEGLAPGLYRLEETVPDAEHNYRVTTPRWMVLPFVSATGDSFTYENVIVVKASAPVTTGAPRTPGPSGTAGTPDTSDTPETPDTPGTPSTTSAAPSTVVQHSPEGAPGRLLASTGANVLWLTAAGFLLIAIGFWMSRERDDHA